MMTNEWNAQGAAPGNGRSRLSPAERRQRNLVIALSVGAVLVLIAGMIAFVATQDGGIAGPPATSEQSTLVTTVPGASTTDPLGTTTVTDVSTTSTIPPTTVVIPANAEAIDDVAVSRSGEFTLIATNLAEGTPNAAIRWTQTAGPDVTAGVGSLRGAEAAAIAPATVSTLVFTLEVAGTDGVATDEIVVRVLEDAARAVFVDGERGADNADGSIAAPFRTLSAAVQAKPGNDIYLRSVGSYDTSAATLTLDDGVSIYGGYDENWLRDTNRRAVIEGASTAIRATGSSDRWLSAIDVTAGAAAAGEPSVAVLIEGAGIVFLADSRVVGGAAGAGVDSDDGSGDGSDGGGAGGWSAGVRVVGAREVRIERSTVNAGRGGRGGDGGSPEDPATSSAAGLAASGRTAGAGGGSGAVAGGRGGDGGNTSGGQTAPGGGAGGTVGSPDGQPGSGGAGGDGGRGGNGGNGSISADDGATVPAGRAGVLGDVGDSGDGGTGGGGGNGPVLVDGGGGGGGGAGGLGADGGAPGGGGGGSIGVWATGVDRLIVTESLLAGGRGGDGGDGGAGTSGQIGGAGGTGAAGRVGVLADGGDGGGAGGGGAGGTGGQGGGGAGGPSFGMLTTRVLVVDVSATTVRGGLGGRGADAGVGGAPGLGGSDGDARRGGLGGEPATDVNAESGVGATGGSSFGWFDDDAAERLLDQAEFVEGNAGAGGAGSTRGDDGDQLASNT